MNHPRVEVTKGVITLVKSHEIQQDLIEKSRKNPHMFVLLQNFQMDITLQPLARFYILTLENESTGVYVSFLVSKTYSIFRNEIIFVHQECSQYKKYVFENFEKNTFEIFLVD